MADRKELTIYTLHYIEVIHTCRTDNSMTDRQELPIYTHAEVIHTCWTYNSMADRKELTIYTLHRSHTYVLDRQFNGRQKRVYYLHTTQKSYIRAGQTIQWPTEKS